MTNYSESYGLLRYFTYVRGYDIREHNVLISWDAT